MSISGQLWGIHSEASQLAHTPESNVREWRLREGKYQSISTVGIAGFKISKASEITPLLFPTAALK